MAYDLLFVRYMDTFPGGMARNFVVLHAIGPLKHHKRPASTVSNASSSTQDTILRFAVSLIITNLLVIFGLICLN